MHTHTHMAEAEVANIGMHFLHVNEHNHGKNPDRFRMEIVNLFRALSLVLCVIAVRLAANAFPK